MTRNILNIPLYLTLAFALVSCSFLEVDDHGKSDTDSFFSDVDGLKMAGIGLYSVTYDFYNQFLFKYADVAGDALQAASVGASADMYYQYNFLSTPDLESTAVGMLWKKGYVVVTNANTILNYVDDLKKEYPSQVSTIESIEADALFFRALAHFELLRCYAQSYSYTSDASHLGIPIVDHVAGTSEKIARSSVAKVYEFVISDLEKAVSLIGEDAPSDARYVSGLACDAFLSRVYLYKGDLTAAESLATKVISVTPLTSYSDYKAMYTEEKLGSEAVLRLSGYYAASTLKTFYNYQSPYYYPASDFIKKFSSSDVRLTVLTAPDGSAACMKYYDLTGNAVDAQHYDLTLFRSSEMYLTRAEARCMNNDLKGAEEDILAIQKRALNSSSLTLSYSGQKALLDIIKTERSKELCFEGHRFFDLARWGDDVKRPSDTNSSLKTLVYPDHRYVLPIPLVELEANGAMVQNEGY